MKGMGIRVHTLREMEIFMQQHPELFDDAQQMSKIGKSSEALRRQFPNAGWFRGETLGDTKKNALINTSQITIEDKGEYGAFVSDAFQNQKRIVNGIGYAFTGNNLYIFDVDNNGFPIPKYQVPTNERNRQLIRDLTNGRTLSNTDEDLAKRLGILELNHDQRRSLLSYFSEGARRNNSNASMVKRGNRGQQQDREGINVSSINGESNPNSKEYRRELARIRREIGEIISINNSLSSQEKSNIRNLLRAINRTDTTLLDDGDGTMYLLDHTDREDIENRNRRHQDGFNCRLKFSINGYSKQEIDAIKKEIENGNIRDQESFDKWAKFNLNQQGRDNSDSIDAQVRTTNENNDRLDLQTSERRSDRGPDYQDSQGNLGTSYIKVYGNDGTNGPRYVAIDKNNSDIEFLKTPSGEVYGFVYQGEIYIDETKLDPQAPVHEYTHIWESKLEPLVIISRNLVSILDGPSGTE